MSVPSPRRSHKDHGLAALAWVVKPPMRYLLLAASAVLGTALFGCGAPAIEGTMSARAAPFPVLLGPTRCLGSCPAPLPGRHRLSPLEVVLSRLESEASADVFTGVRTRSERRASFGEAAFSHRVVTALEGEPSRGGISILLDSVTIVREEHQASSTGREEREITLSGQANGSVLHWPAAVSP